MEKKRKKSRRVRASCPVHGDTEFYMYKEKGGRQQKRCRQCRIERSRKDRAKLRACGDGKYVLKNCVLHGTVRYHRIRGYCTLCEQLKRMQKLGYSFSHQEQLRILEIQKDLCALCGEVIPYKTLDNVTTRHRTDYYNVSWDRKSPKEGYVPGNVWAVHWACNRMKGELEMEDFLRIARKIVERHK